MSSKCLQSDGKRYILGHKIGEGSYSEVFHAKIVGGVGDFACKVVSKQKLTEEKVLPLFESEIVVHRQMNHKNVVKLLDFFEDSSNYYMILEYCSNGDLLHWILSEKYIIESISKVYFKQIAESVMYMHENKIVHRDLKPENILICEDSSIKISDFGFSMVMIKEEPLTSHCGSLCYSSPECINGQPYDGFKSDIWGLGVILYTMLTGKLPWTKNDVKGIAKQITNGDFKCPSYITPLCQDLLFKMMNIDQNTRFSIFEVIKHPWLSSCVTISKNVSSPNSVSLKKVENILFNKENDILLSINEPNFGSYHMLSIEKTSRILSDSSYSLIIKKKSPDPPTEIIKRKRYKTIIKTIHIPVGLNFRPQINGHRRNNSFS